MTITPSPLTNGACWPRELKPTVLLCAHITANMASAANQVHYANRPGSGGPSAHDYLDVDGSGLEALDPAKFAAWSNGDVQAPNLTIPTVKAAVVAHVNPNKIVWREVECVGDGAHPLTGAQLEQLAQFVAADAKATGLPINRSTVTTHADWNSVTRNNCAFPPSVREQRLASIIARAIAILHPAAPAPKPASWRIHIPAGSTVQQATLTPTGQIAAWSPRKVAVAFDGPCSAPVKKAGKDHGSAMVVRILIRPLSGIWVADAPPAVVTES
jgi:hypothetical protein